MRAAKVDGNHAAIVQALRGIGATARSLAALGQGCPDLLVGYRGRNLLLEIKDGSLPPSARKLTTAEQEFIDTWAGQVAVVTSVDEAVRLVVEELRP